MPGRHRLWLWILCSSQPFPVNSGKSDWPGKWPNSLLLMTPLQQKQCVGRQVVSSWGGGGGMHHLLFKQKHLFGMLSILSVRAWTTSSQERLDIVINTSGGRLLHLPACLEKNNLLNLLGAIAVRTRATVTGSTAATSGWSSCFRAMLWGRDTGLDIGHWMPIWVRACAFAS